MGLGGGTFITQNKVLPGTYINFISAAKATAILSDRGYATMALELDWGVDGEIFEITVDDTIKQNSIKLFGYEYTHEKLKGIRDLFLNVKTFYAYRLNTGVKASNAYATAKCSGVRGNDIKIAIFTNVDDNTKFDVSTLIDNAILDTQTVLNATELTHNDFVEFKTDSTLALTASTPLEGGTNGTVTAESHQTYLNKAEAYAFNTMGCLSTDDAIKQLYVNYTKRMRDEIGAKFQLVVHNKAADFEGVINIKNTCDDLASGLVYFVTGIQAGTEVNRSSLNKIYDGEFTFNVDFTQSQLIAAIKAGEYTLHKVGSDIRILNDINSLVSTTLTKGEIFKDNQTIRVIDQIANDIANIFNTRYLGIIPNDESGRISLWNDIVNFHKQLETIRAIENFDDKNVQVFAGESKKAVVVSTNITVINAMAQLYMQVEVN